MSGPNSLLTDAHREIGAAAGDILSVAINFDKRRPGLSAVEVAQAKRRLTRAIAALTALENQTGMTEPPHD